jgi:hypothetical protein
MAEVRRAVKGKGLISGVTSCASMCISAISANAGHAIVDGTIFIGVSMSMIF